MADSGPCDPARLGVGGDHVDRHTHPGPVRTSVWQLAKWPLIYVAAAGLIALAACYRGSTVASQTCEQDGQRIVQELHVDFQTSDGKWHAFCSIVCARRWISQHPDTQVRQAIVRDALTGSPLDAYVAFFVQSSIVTNEANGNNIHAFQYRTDAIEHARRFHGHEIEEPFGVD